MKLSCTSIYNKHVYFLTQHSGRQPLQSKGTVVPVSRVAALRDPIWAFQLLRVEDKVAHLKVCTSPDAIVGRYNLFIETTHKNEQGEVEKYRYAQPDDIYILFNPWCPGMLWLCCI